METPHFNTLIVSLPPLKHHGEPEVISPCVHWYPPPQKKKDNLSLSFIHYDELKSETGWTPKNNRRDCADLRCVFTRLNNQKQTVCKKKTHEQNPPKWCLVPVYARVSVTWGAEEQEQSWHAEEPHVPLSDAPRWRIRDGSLQVWGLRTDSGASSRACWDERAPPPPTRPRSYPRPLTHAAGRHHVIRNSAISCALPSQNKHPTLTREI